MNSRRSIIDKFKLLFNNKKLNTTTTSSNETLASKFRIFSESFRKNNNNKKFFDYFKNTGGSKAKSRRFLFTSTTTYCTAAAYYHKFSWDEYRIRNDELREYVKEILDEFGQSDQVSSSAASGELVSADINQNQNDKSWEKIFTRHDLVIWRRILVEPNEESSAGLFEYKVFGRLYDVSAIDFFRTQIDLDYRKKWDHLVVKLQILSTDEKYKDETSEVVQWIMKYPFPMNSREYIFIRRYCVEPELGLLVLVSTSITNPNVTFLKDDDEESEEGDTKAIISHHLGNGDAKKKPESNSKSRTSATAYEQPHQQAPYVRVTKYKSNMIIVPHKKDAFDENGLDFYLQYYDDPKARIPNMAYKWMATSGLPDWLDKLHKAAKNIPKPSKKIELLRDFELFYLNERPTPPPIEEPTTPAPVAATDTTQTTTTCVEDIESKPKKKKRIHHFDMEPHSFFY